MNDYFEDLLEPLGALGGGFVVIVALGTLIGTPWSAAQTATVGIAQTLGVLLMLLLGLGIVAITSPGPLPFAEDDESTQ